RPPPRPVLSPYTTLFRSEFPALPSGTVKAVVRDAPDHYLRIISVEVVLGLYGLQGDFWAPSQIEDWLTKQRAMTMALLPRILMKDRKSTRLNSSHVKISY